VQVASPSPGDAELIERLNQGADWAERWVRRLLKRRTFRANKVAGDLATAVQDYRQAASRLRALSQPPAGKPTSEREAEIREWYSEGRYDDVNGDGWEHVGDLLSLLDAERAEKERMREALQGLLTVSRYSPPESPGGEYNNRMIDNATAALSPRPKEPK